MFTSTWTRISIESPITREEEAYQFAALKNIGNRKDHINNLRNTDITRVSNLDHSAWCIRVVVVGANGRNSCSVCITIDTRAGRDEDSISHNVSSSGEIDDFASSVLRQDRVDIGGVVGSTVTINGQVCN